MAKDNTLQLARNSICLRFIELWNNEDTTSWELVRHARLRYCKACVLTYENKVTKKRVHLLQSYNTIIAAVMHDTGLALDFLRYVYGYTSTSAQHIRKFFQDYNAQEINRYYPVKGA